MPSACTSPKKPCEIAVGGLVPFTTVDFPGRLAAVVFCQGCAWRCGYCHNTHLRDFSPGRISWSSVLEFLRKRQNLLEAVVFSGGEPLAQRALPRAMQEARALGYRIGLHTAGSNPRRLKEVLPLLDWVGLDFKAPSARYREITQSSGAGETRRSLRSIIETGVPYEVRTTLDERLSEADLTALRTEIGPAAAQRWVLQERRPRV
jgi:pyruvate formate lyase activating enzyme